MHLFFHLHISKKPFKLAVRSLDANDVGSVLLHVGEDGVEYPLSYSLKKFDVLQRYLPYKFSYLFLASSYSFMSWFLIIFKRISPSTLTILFMAILYK